MWKWKHFDAIDSLLQFVNELQLEHHEFKVVNSHAPRRSGPYGAPMYLIYRDRHQNTGDPDLEAEEATPLAEEQESALSAAVHILHGSPEGAEEQ